MITALTCINAKAVSLLEQGLHQAAVRMLSRAVKECGSLLSHVVPEENTCLPLGLAVAPSSQSKTPQHEEFFALPFQMAAHLELRSKHVSQETLAAGVAVCCFNMGLACHLEWVRRQRNDSRVLHQAQVFYGKAYGALQLCQVQSQDALLLLRLSVYRNLMSLNLELGQLVTVQQLRDNLAFTVSHAHANRMQFNDEVSLHYLYLTHMLCRSDLVAARAA